MNKLIDLEKYDNIGKIPEFCDICKVPFYGCAGYPVLIPNSHNTNLVEKQKYSCFMCFSKNIDN